MRLMFLPLLLWSIAVGHPKAQTASSSLPLLYNAENKGVTGFAVKVGERIIGVAVATYFTERQFDWALWGQKHGWKFDSTKMLRPMNLGYYPLIENGPPPPVVVYNPVFSLADGEPLILHDGLGATLQGKFMIRDYKTGSYSSDMGFRPLMVRLPDLPQKKDELSFKVVTKADGKQVVGMVLSSTSFQDPNTKSRVKALNFEPLLVGHPVFLGLPTPTITKIFGRTVSPGAANTLARWISAEFFPIQVGDNVKPWQAAWRVAPGTTTFVIKGGDMRQCYDTMVVNTVAVSAADTKKDRMHDAGFNRRGSGDKQGRYDGAEFVNALIDAFGDPAEASYFKDNRDDLVLLRFNMTSTADFLVSIGAYGPGRASLRQAGTSFRIIEQRAYAKEAKLATTRKDVLDALKLLKQP